MPIAPTLSPPPSRSGEARLRVRAARPDLHPESPAFRAAVVLLAGPEQRFNIDRIASRCALPRPAVAACVRRLIDNGVWAGGRAVCPWRSPDDPRFWNDAAVAEGRLLRRTLPDGAVEWAPPGRWEKAYDFVGPQSDPGGAVLYLDPAERETAAGADGEEEEEPPPRFEAPREARVEPRIPALSLGGGQWLGVPAGIPDLFPGASWLR